MPNGFTRYSQRKRVGTKPAAVVTVEATVVTDASIKMVPIQDITMSALLHHAALPALCKHADSMWVFSMNLPNIGASIVDRRMRFEKMKPDRMGELKNQKFDKERQSCQRTLFTG
jgi:hypothetical protein